MYSDVVLTFARSVYALCDDVIIML